MSIPERQPDAGGSVTRDDTIRHLVVFLIIGAVAGWLASGLDQGASRGVVGDSVVGTVVVLIGGFVLSFLAPDMFALISFNETSLVIAFIGAVSLLFVVKLFRGRRAVS